MNEIIAIPNTLRLHLIPRTLVRVLKVSYHAAPASDLSLQYE